MNETSCSRDLSRTVRNFIEKELFIGFNVNIDKLPLNCLLNPRLDLFKNQETMKEEVSYDDWKVNFFNTGLL
jgi:hypothetical protein